MNEYLKDELEKLLEESECNSIDVHLLVDADAVSSNHPPAYYGDDFKPRVPKDEFQK